MKHGFVKVGTATPHGRVADPAYNASEMARIAKNAAAEGVSVLVYPELCITGYTAGDLLLSETLLNTAMDALKSYLTETETLDMVSVVGLPITVGNKLYNCAAVCQSGKLLGLIPKTAIPAYGEFCEARYFTSADDAVRDTLQIDGREVPFGTDLLFPCNELPSLRLAVEIGSDTDLLVPPSLGAVAAGATLIAVPAASSEGVCKTERRRKQLEAISSRAIAAYLYSAAGAGESTTDTVFGGHDLIAEYGTLLAEKTPFAAQELIFTEIDVQKILFERRRVNIYPTDFCENYREIPFSLQKSETKLTRTIDPHPFMPADPAEQAHPRRHSPPGPRHRPAHDGDHVPDRVLDPPHSQGIRP